MATALDEALNKKSGSGKVTEIKAKRGTDTTLGSLTQVAKQIEQPADADIVEIDADKIDFSPDINHREQGWLSDANSGFVKLLKSIERNGQKIPIMVKRKEGGRYELIYGSRRRQVAISLDRPVRAIIASGISDTEAHTLALLENQNNEGLSPIEEARAVLGYKEKHAPISDSDVASVFSKSRQWVSYQNSLATLDPLIIDQCSNPWVITERATRDFRKTWNADTKSRDRWKKILNNLAKKDKKLPFNALLKELVGDEEPNAVTVVKNKNGSIAAEVKKATTKSGKKIRWICVHESFEKTAVNKLITAMHKDFDVTINDD